MNAMSRVEPAPLLKVDGLSKWYGHIPGCMDVSFEMANSIFPSLLKCIKSIFRARIAPMGPDNH